MVKDRVRIMSRVLGQRGEARAWSRLGIGLGFGLGSADTPPSPTRTPRYISPTSPLYLPYISHGSLDLTLTLTHTPTRALTLTLILTLTLTLTP